MKLWTLFNAAAVMALTLVGTEGCPLRAAEQGTHGSMPMDSMPMDMGGASGSAGDASSPGAAGAVAGSQPGQVAFQALKQLIGSKWEAPLGGNKTIVDTFQPFAFGTAILAEEWVGAEQVTSTVFYMVGSELRADHYCDYGNQPRYVAQPSADPSIIKLEFREATNLDTHPRHFHSTQWHFVDAIHMTQDWDVDGGPKGKSTVHLEFVKRQ